jgi:hypothetical protein
MMEELMAQQQVDREARRVAEGGEADQKSQSNAKQGDNRTPDKTIGQVKYADNQGRGGRDAASGSGNSPQPKEESRAND